MYRFVIARKWQTQLDRWRGLCLRRDEKADLDVLVVIAVFLEEFLIVAPPMEGPRIKIRLQSEHQCHHLREIIDK